ncbi:MAG: hypothetical protein HRU02_06440 [Myxococcales bacterium]|nr:hypothetical protein [Myxococcales bacterium]
MARSGIPGALERRHLVEKDLAPAHAQRIADAYLAEDRRLEAVDFLGKVDPADGLQELRAQAVEEGDVFLLRGVAQAMGERPSREEWQALAESASTLGKLRYAEEARRQAERGEG